jgi:hypothetical protein
MTDAAQATLAIGGMLIGLASYLWLRLESARLDRLYGPND